MATASASFGLSQIGQIAVNVHDIKRAVAFYRDTLGMKFLFEAGTLAFFDCGGIRLMLSPPETPEFDHPASIIYYRVENIHTAHDTLSGRGVKFEDKPHLIARLPGREIWMCFFRDPDNNLLGLTSEVPSA